MHCERCNVDFSEGLRYCKWCGEALVDRPRITSELHSCPSCSAAIQPGWTFCKACGEGFRVLPVSSRKPRAPHAAPSLPPERRNAHAAGVTPPPPASARSLLKQKLRSLPRRARRVENGLTPGHSTAKDADPRFTPNKHHLADRRCFATSAKAIARSVRGNAAFAAPLSLRARVRWSIFHRFKPPARISRQRFRISTSN